MYNINFIGRRKIWYSFSLLLIVLSIAAISIFGLNYGLDFTGGSLLEVNFSLERPAMEDIAGAIDQYSVTAPRIQPSGEQDYLIRLPHLTEEIHQTVLTSLIELGLATNLDNEVTENRFESFGPSLGRELRQSAFYAIIFALIAIIIYVAYAFRKVAKPVAAWKFGTIAVIALIHDAVIVIGLFAALGYLLAVEIDSFFITALLTLLGFSVHDTIVTLDRVRENLLTHRDKSFPAIVNISINQTVTRSINTSVTTLFTLVAIYLFGGLSIKNFSLALIAGIAIGTYSSLFIAAPLLVTWYNFSRRKLG